jgi:hypothetical protein
VGKTNIRSTRLFPPWGGEWDQISAAAPITDALFFESVFSCLAKFVSYTIFCSYSFNESNQPEVG